MKKSTFFTKGRKILHSLPTLMTTIRHGMLVVLAAILFTACHDDSAPETHVSRQTVMIFMPWCSNMVGFFEDNLRDLEKAVGEGVLTDERVVVCIAPNPQKVMYIELREEKGKSVRDTLQTITNPDYTLPGNITTMLRDLTQYAPARRYSLIIGGHGMAWLPVGSTPRSMLMHRAQYSKKPQTRWFGGLVPEYQIEISTLVQAINSTGLHFDYILFDDCYMSSVEAIYDLRGVTDYVVACPTEVMGYGFPYSQCARFLIGNVDYHQICEAFLDFYESYDYPFGTVAVTDCRQLEALADVVRTINAGYLDAYHSDASIQSMDGYSPTIFLDMGDVYDHICKDATLLAKFHEQLARAVPYKACTMYYYTANKGRCKIDCFSGITTSETSENAAAATLSQTAWYKATH